MVGLPLYALGAAAVCCLLACSAFFSSTETAMFSLPDEWIDSRAAEGSGGAQLEELRDDPHRLLVTLLVGNNVVNIAMASIVTVLVGSVLPTGAAVVVTTVLTSVVVLVFGEIVPKSYGLARAETWAVRTARTVRRVEWLLWPVIVLFEAVTRRASAALGAAPDIERPYLD